jgi:hypothetical protein
MSEGSASPDYGSLARALDHYRKRCSELEAENARLRKELFALKTTVSAVVARSIDAKADIGGSAGKSPEEERTSRRGQEQSFRRVYRSLFAIRHFAGRP